MSKFKGELWAAFIVVTMTTGTALAQSPDDQQPIMSDPVEDPTSPTQAAPTPAPLPAQAQPPPVQVEVYTPPPAPPPPVTYESEDRGGMMGSMSRVGFSLSLGGGVAHFTDDQMRDTTGIGGTWALRAAIGTKTPFGVEASYIGSAQEIDALGIASDAVLVSNGLQGALRLNAAIGAPVTPFLFGGAAWRRYSLANTNVNTSAISDKDDLFEIPVGLGIGGSFLGLGFDIRGELRYAFAEDMVPEFEAGRDTGGNADMHSWGVNATLGFGF
ncbi:MAG TPA: hypothetical protein VK932_19475 [Kofleriaceae bacterium]|nr:hypothetical protein [Kofleriaceae bacterium]